MKQRIIIIGLTILMNLSLFGQDFISSDKQWNVRLTGWAGVFSTEIYVIDGDSVINSLIYNKIWASFDSLSTWQYQGLIREDSNIVYYIPPNGNEGILYDFNLEIGDTAYVTNVFCSDIPIYVIDIDTVEYNGISRKRWLLGEDGYVQESWVEGIGSLYGPLHTKFEYCIVCPFWELLCYHNNDTLEYIMYGQTDCYQNTVGLDENFRESDFSINPNPVKIGSIINIETNSVPNSISIFNSSGLLIKRLSQFRDKIIRIETNDFKPGMYFITIKTNGDRINTQKIMIE